MRGQPISLTDFHGGVNTKDADFLLAENECRNCQNVVSTARGSIKKRNGNTTFSSAFTGTPTAINSLAGIETVGPNLIATAGTKIYSISNTGVNADITGAAASTNNSKWETIEAPLGAGPQGPVYMMNGTDPALQWSGAGNVAVWTTAAGPALPNGKYCIYFKNRVWVAGVAANPSRLFWSDIGDPRSFPAPNVVDLDPNDGDVITGLGTYGPYLLVFKRNKLFRVHDLDAGANTVISTSVGAASHRSIVESPFGTFFLTNDKGVYLYNGSSLKQLSDKITPTLEGIVAASRENAAGAYYQNHYYLSVCNSATTNNLTLDYDVQLDSWWFHDNPVNQFALWRKSSVYELYAAQATAGIVDISYQPNVLTDNGTGIVCLWLGPWLTVGAFRRSHFLNEPYRNKRWRQIHVDGSGVVDMSLGKDYLGVTLIKGDIFTAARGVITLFGGVDNFGGDGTFGGNIAAQARARIYSEGVARAFSVQFSSTGNKAFEVDGYTPFITLRQN